jgi:hypothetical protein
MAEDLSKYLKPLAKEEDDSIEDLSQYLKPLKNEEELSLEGQLREEDLDSRNLETFGKSAADALTLGYSPEIYGAVSAPFSDKDYVALRDEYKNELGQLQKANPVPSGAGTITGALAPFLLTGGGSAVASGAKAVQLAKAGQAAKTSAQLGKAALSGLKSGAILGGLSNPGSNEGEIEPLQLEDRAENALAGGVLGGLTGAAFEGAAIKAPQMKEWLKKKAADSSFNSLRAAKKFTDRLRKGESTEIGMDMLDRKLTGGVPKSRDAMLNEVDDILQEQGKIKGQIFDDITDAEMQIQKSTGMTGGIDKEMVADKIMEKTVDFSEAGNKQLNNKIFEELDDFLNAGAGRKPLDLKTADEVRAKIGAKMEKNGAWKRLKRGEPTEDDLFQAAKYDVMSEAILDYATGIAKASGKESTAASLIDMKKTYSQFKKIKDMLRNSTSAAQANRGYGLTEQIGTGVGSLVGMATGGGPVSTAVGGALGAGVANTVKKYGNQAAASGYNMLSKNADKIGTAFSTLSSNPMTGQNVVQGYKRLIENYNNKKYVSPNDAAKMYQEDGAR